MFSGSRTVLLIACALLSSGCLSEGKFVERARELSCEVETMCVGPDVEPHCDPTWINRQADDHCYDYKPKQAAQCLEELEELHARVEAGDADACYEFAAYECSFTESNDMPSCSAT